jgi:hypothetical protein
MTTKTLGARAESGDEKDQAALRYAMLSVYYRSLGSQLESRGAPVMAVPPEVRPLPLDEALDRLKGSDDRLWDAYWRIVRSVPVVGWKERRLERRYPWALFALRGRDEIEYLDNLRQKACSTAHLLAAALAACAEERWDEAKALADMLEAKSGGAAQEITDTTESTLGLPAHEFVRWLATPPKSQANSEGDLGLRADQLRKLPAEVGLNLNDFVSDFLDTVAFARFKTECEAPDSVLTSSCIVRQDTSTLTTTATVTALVESDFDVLARVLDPLGWPRCSDVILDTQYLTDPFDLTTKLEKGTLGRGFKSREPQFLYEQVGVTWGDDRVQTGEFQNVLVIDPFKVDADCRTITIRYRLCWSIDSRILWDQRAGGILIDEGYILVRPVGDERLRMTARKVLKFSDRTPYSNAPGWLDFGQMLNFLAPASVTWWLETELYSSQCMRDEAKKNAAAQQPTSKGAA